MIGFTKAGHFGRNERHTHHAALAAHNEHSGERRLPAVNVMAFHYWDWAMCTLPSFNGAVMPPHSKTAERCGEITARDGPDSPPQ